jgi:hypothetical protein
LRLAPLRPWPRLDSLGWTLVFVLLAGLGARLASLAIQSRLPLEPDAVGTLELAKDFNFANPWAASLREPGWIALVKT